MGAADDPETALPLLESLHPDIVRLDVSIGQHGTELGLAACRTISQRFPTTGVIVLTTFLEE